MNCKSIIVTVFTVLAMVFACNKQQSGNGTFLISDPALQMQLVAASPEIKTPIGLAIDHHDDLYVLESHTHTPPKGYTGPRYDQIKKGVDNNKDGIPEFWIIYADSIEDGMNLAFGPDQQLFLTTKNAVWVFQDTNGDGVSDYRRLLLDMIAPESPYDHAAILGIAVSPDYQWLFVTRGNTGSDYWKVKGTDGAVISGYGDGGNVMRCKLDGSELEEIATGFWNPFDIRFTMNGRLLLTDNDPDSRGPNRLIEIVPGGDYGYKSLYGGSGLHPFVAWNGELPGTLPYAVPLGEAACALLDASFTSFGPKYLQNILVCVWEEKNIVRVPLTSHRSTVAGTPEILVQGDGTFHPVALAANSKGEVYITDWVVREYPNHGEGKVWRLRSQQSSTVESENTPLHYKFDSVDTTLENNLELLATGDAFQKASVRYHLSRVEENGLEELLHSSDPELRLQAILIYNLKSENLAEIQLQSLLEDNDQQVRQAVMMYIGSRRLYGMLESVVRSLQKGLISAELFETYLATIQNLQPDFIQGFQEKKVRSNQLERKLPERFILDIITNQHISESIRALALPYLNDIEQHGQQLIDLLSSARTESFQLSLLAAVHTNGHLLNKQKVKQVLISLASDQHNSDRVRSNAIASISESSAENLEQVKELLNSKSAALQYAVTKYIAQYATESERNAVDKWMKSNNIRLSASAEAVWNQMKAGTEEFQMNQWAGAVDGTGNPNIGELVFKSNTSMCLTCHKVDGWGGTFGPALTQVGSSKNQQQLINAVLYPSLEMAPEWQGWYVIDKEGKRHTGRQIDVHMKRVELMNIRGDFDNFPEPQSYGVLTESVMPAGLQNNMTPEEFSDLVAYLVSLK